MTKDLEVRQCRVLLAVKDSGGISAAARALGVAQSTVSETLLSLERILGAPVIARRPGQGAMLTAAGDTLIPHARMLVSTAEAALADVARQTQNAIRLGAVESISSFLLPKPLSAFRQLCPDVDVQIAIGLCEGLRERVGRSELDVALTIEGDATQLDEHVPSELRRARLLFVVAPRHRWTQRIITRDDLTGQTLLVTDHEGAFNTLLNSWLGLGGRLPRLESAGSIDGVKHGVLSDDAIGVLPDYAVSEELSARALMALKLRDPAPPISLRLTTRKAPQPGSPLQSLIGQIREGLPPLPSANSSTA